MVRNLSETGAALDLFYTLSVPDQFKLVVADDDVGRDCCVVWRHENRLGVSFRSDLLFRPALISKRISAIPIQRRKTLVRNRDRAFLSAVI